MERIKHHTRNALKRSEKYTKVDMLYLAEGGFWLTIGQVAASVFSLLIATAFANLVPPETFGTYKYVVTMISLLSIPTLGGINAAYNQAVARGYEGAFKSALRTRIKWGLLGTAGSLFLSVYYYINDNSVLTTSFLIVALFIPFFETLGIYGPLLGGKKLFKKSTQYFFVTRVVSFIAIVVTIYLTDNLLYILLAYLLPLTLVQAVLLFNVFRKYPLNDKDDGMTVPYGKHLSFVGFIGNATRYFDNLALFHYLGAAPLAVYSLAIAPIDQVSGLYKGLIMLLVPKISIRSGEEILSTFWRRFALVTCVSGVFSVLYFLLVPYLFPLLFPLYTSAVVYAQMLTGILFLSLPLTFMQGITRSRLDVTPKSFLYWRIVPRIIFLVSLFLFVPLYGIVGAIASRTILSVAMLVNLFSQWRVLSKIKREPITE